MDGTEIYTPPVSGFPRTWLCLRGTILTIREKTWWRESIVHVPIELVAFTEDRRFRGTFLILSLLSPFVWIFAGVVGHFVYASFADSPVGRIATVVAFSAIGGASVVSFWYFLICFASRRRTVTFDVGLKKGALSVWINRKDDTSMSRLLAEIKRRQPLVETHVAQSVGMEVRIRPLLGAMLLTAALAYGLALPRIPWLVLFATIPFLRWAWQELRLFACPRQYRRALRAMQANRLDAALKHAQELAAAYPDVPASHLLLIDVFIQRDEHNAAEEQLDHIVQDLPPEMEASLREWIHLCRTIKQRRETLPVSGEDPVHSPA